MLFLAGTNAGETFGIAEIGVYGRRLFRKNKNLFVKFKYRSSALQKVVKRMRIKVITENNAGINDAIRNWLMSTKKFASRTVSTVSTVSSIDTLFHRPIDSEVRQQSYDELQNSIKGNSSRNATPPAKRKPLVTSNSLKKLIKYKAVDQYRIKKREQRHQEKMKLQSLVFRL